jgi:hypothetical protein
MSTLIYSDILTLAQNAGFEAVDSDIASAVALAESSGNTQAYNPETSSTPQGLGSYGLWQIYLKAHPEFTGENLFDPVTNAKAAFSVYSNSGRTFTAWSTYNSGLYKQFLEGTSTKIVSIPIQFAPTTITTVVPASQLRTLSSTPVLIAPSPGPGLYIAPQVLSVIFRSLDGSFTTGDHAFFVGWTKSAITNKFASFNKHGLIDQPVDRFVNIPCTFINPILGSTIGNAPVYLTSLGSEITGAATKSHLQVTLTYTLLPI